MSYIHSFAGYEPDPQDPTPYTGAVIRQAASPDGPFTIVDTLAFAPGVVPAVLTTDQATLEQAWFTVAFTDTDGDESPQTLPALSPAVSAPVDLVLGQWAPDPDVIARLCGSYTRAPMAAGSAGYTGVIGDAGQPQPQAGRERGVFTEDTSPTLSQVEGFIFEACSEVLGRTGVLEMPERCWKLARTTAQWHAAASVEAKRRPSTSDDAGGLQSWFTSNYRACLLELIEQTSIWIPVFS